MKIYFLWVILLFNTTFAYLKENNDTLAIIGKTNISSDEFIERYEFTPWPRSKFDNSLEAFKKEFLNTLIAEKLWALEAERMGLDTSETMRKTFKSLEKMYVRDALYREEILSKIKVSDNLIKEGYGKIQYLLKVNFKVFTNKTNAGKVYQSLKKGFPFDYVSKEFADISKDSTVQVTFGQMDEEIENILYKMKPGDYTVPIQSKNRWYIFRLAEKKDNPINDAKSENSAEKQVKTIVHDRLVQKRYDEFIKDFFGSKKIKANAHLLRSISDKVYSRLNEKLAEDPGKGKVYFDLKDFTGIEKRFGSDSLKMSFILLDSEHISVKQFLDEIANEEFYIESVPNKSELASEVLNRMNARVKEFIEQELLAREGYKRGIQNLPEVKNELKMWREYYLSQLHKKQFADNISVTNDEIKNYYDKRYTGGESIPEVNIVEILTDSLEVIEKVLDKLKNHADMHDLARQYTKRESMREKNGEFGFFPVTMYGEIGKIAGTLKVGEVYGPLKVPEGYSVFQVIAKRDSNKVQPKSFEESKEEIKRNLTQFKLNREVVNHTVQLARNYGIKINEKALSSVKVNNITMFVYKYMGFGGRITSVPLIIPFTDWVEEWQKDKTNMP